MGTLFYGRNDWKLHFAGGIATRTMILIENNVIF